MRIAHFGPFASPARKALCGQYETIRDMIVAERLLGHVVDLVDTGIGRERVVGPSLVDDRGDFDLFPVDYDAVKDYDLFVCHTDMLTSYLDQTKAPVVQIMHGRPLASFRLQQQEPKKAPVFSLYHAYGQNPRYKMFVSLWPEHLPYWEVVVPPDKLRATSAPPCNVNEWTHDGVTHAFTPTDAFHVLVTDMWRPDGDPFHVAYALIEAAKKLKNMKCHFYACNTNLGPWQHVFRHLRSLGVLGETKGTIRGLAPMYRGADLVVTHHTIGTRIIREALSCGTPVVAGEGCDYTPFTARPDNIQRFSGMIVKAAERVMADPLRAARASMEMAKRFALERVGPELITLYEEAVDA